MFDQDVAASWSDDYTTACTVEVSLTTGDNAEPKPVKTGDILKDAGKLTINVADEFQNKATGVIILTREDRQAPTLTVSITEKNVIAGVTVTVKDNQLLFNEAVAASWSDDYTTACTVELSLTTSDNAEPKSVKTGDILKDAGKLTITVADEFQNKASGEITLTREDNQAPILTVAIPEKNVIAGVTVTVNNNQLLFNEDVAASWTDDYTTACTVELSLTTGNNAEPIPVKTGDVLKDAGKLTITVADEFQNKTSGEITLTREDSQAPTLTVSITEKNVIAGVTVTIKDKELLFDQDVAASWTDDYTETCSVQMVVIS